MKSSERVRGPRIFGWRGVLSDETRMVRMVVGALLAVLCVSLSFTQLGFLGVGLHGNYIAYAVPLLVPIALEALLLGMLSGTLLGLFAGAVLYLHAIVMPLNYYELSFVTPITSVLMLAVSGFLLSFMFAVALRKKPPLGRSIVYIIIVCIIMSWLYSIGFVINSLLQLVFDLALSSTVLNLSSEEVSAVADADLARIFLRLGDISMQIWIDALLMALSCVIANAVARRQIARDERVGLRALFAVWLIIVAAFAFMITSAISFTAITLGELVDARSFIGEEVDYVCNQLDASEKRLDMVLDVLKDASNGDDLSLSESGYEGLSEVASMEPLLEGYDKDEDGTVMVLVGDDASSLSDFFVLLSNDDMLSKKGLLKDVVAPDVVKAIGQSTEDGLLKRVIYDEGSVPVKDYSMENISSLDSSTIRTQIGFLLAKRHDSFVVVAIVPSNMVFADRATTMTWVSVSSFVLLAAVLAVVALLLSRVVVRRMEATNAVLERITGGDLDARVETYDTREFESLSRGINETVVTLKDWIAEAETRMDAELATAKEIQESALPGIFPPFPDITRFDIYASMNAAKEVGGDFYDFFLMGDSPGAKAGELGFVVADVSGKGVPAALFMMKAKTLIRDYLLSGMELGEAVENANRQLCDGNDAGMFVTAWVGVLDYGTGHVDYVNAGHNPPLVWLKNDWVWLTERSGLPLGLFDGLPYSAFSLDCQIGDQFLLYSDGVTEAMSVDEELYGEDRLEALVREKSALHPRMLVDSVRRDVALHAKGAEQSDDITILALEVGVPPEVTVTLTVPADVGQLPRVNEFIHSELDKRLCPVRTQKQLDIAVEELFVNVCHYAYPDATTDNPGMVRINYTYSAEPPSISVDIIDGGIAYNPLAKPDAVTPDDIADVPIGGLGILMAKQSVDRMSYERVGESNVVTIVKKW